MNPGPQASSPKPQAMNHTDLTLPLFTSALVLCGALLHWHRAKRRRARRIPMTVCGQEQAARDAGRLSPATFHIERVGLVLLSLSLFSLPLSLSAHGGDVPACLVPTLSAEGVIVVDMGGREEGQGEREKGKVFSSSLKPQASSPLYEAPARAMRAIAQEPPWVAWLVVAFGVLCHLAMLLLGARVIHDYGWDRGFSARERLDEESAAERGAALA